MSYRKYLDKIARRFEWLMTISGGELIPTEDFGWHNKRFKSDIFRMAHVERYSDDKIEVLHVTTFPHQWSPEPIFGFDVICTEGKVVGVYMDLSPGLNDIPYTEPSVPFEERKPIPEWATVFSDRFLCVKPKDITEFVRLVNWTVEVYEKYLFCLDRRTEGPIEDIIEKQNTYCRVQSSNPRTYSVLKAKIGEERAKYFMTNILFPTI